MTIAAGSGALTRVSLIEAIERRPRAALGWFLAIHTVLWTILPTLFYPNLPLDLIEALTYGREWQVGHDKLPPLPWWLVEIVFRTVGHDAGYYLMAQIAVVSAFAAIYTLARPLVGDLRAFIAILAIDGLHFFNFTAEKFNHDVIQLPFWALAALAFYRALRTGALRYWILLGLAMGVSLWAKYFFIVLATPLALFLLIDREARVHMRTPGPYLALAVALIVMAPHLIWLVANDFLPFAYADARATIANGGLGHILNPLIFAASQLFFLLPVFVIVAPLFLWRDRAPVAATADAYDRRIVTLLAFGPAATLLILLALTGRGAIAMWGYPLWLCLGLWIVMTWEPALDRVQLTRVVAVWALVTAAFVLAFVGNYVMLPSIDGRYRAVLFPGEQLAAEIDRRYRAASGRPLRYVIGRMWDGGNVAHYSQDQPQVLIDGNPARAPWIDLANLRRQGGVVLWPSTNTQPSEMPSNFRAAAPNAVVQQPFTLPFHRGPHRLFVNWAILPPAL
jgi:4-amino-4-deoxy-L-arabinose transferase-like glycosyltransferase